ncbi:MAG TPA: NRAMP family divalent metal transporter [Acidocella sp.]|uniref:NRAMP family divalent metal transporter n=1 Tax=Acidocella sp. TaxID=50710 RepID=UPI002BC540D6|nr:NRAMP family divalent metal transporter [Acidocella sp.]HVE22519.1 NRAMP family divalent metal transporter [Acidocella sp.]
MSQITKTPTEPAVAVLDQAHLGDIRGAFGTIAKGDIAPRGTWKTRLVTLAAIIGPGLIVMTGDNDAGAFSTYSQAGQNYGYSLLWTLLLMLPVLYVNQEMVIRLGAVSGVGHARLILERFGKFWGAFSVIDLFLLNALTIVSEFIGINLGLQYLGVPKIAGVFVAAVVIIGAASTGDFRKFERFAMCLIAFSFLLVPLFVLVHPPLGAVANGFFLPQMPHVPSNGVAAVLLLVIGIIGTTLAPWQLFFQQSYVVDKRITPRFIRYSRVDLVIGFFIVIGGAVALMTTAATIFAHHPEFGNFTDDLGIADGLQKYVGRLPAVLFALALIDASIIGASAVSLATAYAISDVFKANHSLHRKPKEAKFFYVIYGGLLFGAAALVLTPGVPLGLITNAVQGLAGVLLPSATVFLLLLCNDQAVLGPWVNGRFINLLTGIVIAVMLLLSVILTASVVYPSITGTQIIATLSAGGVFALIVVLMMFAMRRGNGTAKAPPIDRSNQDEWRMPPLDKLPPGGFTPATRVWMMALRGYLFLAGGLVIARIIELALTGAP